MDDAVEKLNAIIVDENFDNFFNNLKCAAAMNLASGFIQGKKMEDSYNFTHTKTISCWIDSNLWAPGKTWQNKKVFSTKLTSLCRGAEKERTRSWELNFYKLANVFVFAASLKDVPIGCKDNVLPKPLLKNHNQLSHE